MAYYESDGMYGYWYLGWGNAGRDAARKVRSELIGRGFEFMGSLILVDSRSNTRHFYCGRLNQAKFFRSKLIIAHNGSPNIWGPGRLLHDAAREILEDTKNYQ